MNQRLYLKFLRQIMWGETLGNLTFTGHNEHSRIGRIKHRITTQLFFGELITELVLVGIKIDNEELCGWVVFYFTFIINSSKFLSMYTPVQNF